MKRESVNKADEANLKLDEKMNEGQNMSNRNDEGRSLTETNIKIQDAFYGEDQRGDTVPTYVTNETAAIKITGGEK